MENIISHKNKSIQLCAIGNGVVDMQYQVSDEILNKINVPKGEMRLVETAEQMAIISSLDPIVPNKCSGGSATNTVAAFAQFGGTGAYLTAVGDDENGKFYIQELDKHRIKYKKNIILNTPTGTCLVLITPDGERTMLTCLAASSKFSLEHLDETLVSNSEWVYLEGYKFSEQLGLETLRKTVEIAKKSNTKISLTASDVFIVSVFNEPFMEILGQSDLLFCNENEAKAIAKCEDSDEAINIISKICPNVVMTKGKNGAKVFFNNKSYDFEACPTEVIDTTGAGDMFAGAFLFGLLNYDKFVKNTDASNLEDKINFSGKLASKASSIIVSQLGARYTGEFDKIIQNIL